MPSIVEAIRELREITGCGMIICREALSKSSSIEGAVEYLRSIGAEPDTPGLSEPRIDVLQNDVVVAIFNTDTELKASEYTGANSKIKFVNAVGHYSYVK